MNLARCQPYLGTYVEISVDADLDFEGLAELSNIGFNAIARVHNLMSYHADDSELTFINKNAAKSPQKISLETHQVIDFCLTLSAQTQGVFDISIASHLINQKLLPNPLETPIGNSTWEAIELTRDTIYFNAPVLIDLGGVAKGYAVDLALQEILTKCPSAIVSINAGGDLKMSQWQRQRVHVSTLKKLVEIEMKAPALATSNYNYLKDKSQGNIINPKTGKVQNLTGSVSIFAPMCMHADALTKVIAVNPNFTLPEQYKASALHLS